MGYWIGRPCLAGVLELGVAEPELAGDEEGDVAPTAHSATATKRSKEQINLAWFNTCHPAEELESDESRCPHGITALCNYAPNGGYVSGALVLRLRFLWSIGRYRLGHCKRALRGE